MINRPKIPARFKSATLAQFSNIPNLGDVKDRQSYFLTGPVGTGKTHLAAAILKEWIKYRHPLATGYQLHAEWNSAFIAVPELLGHIQATFNPKHDTSTEYMQNSFQYAKCLVLDDLGAEKMSEWSFSCLYRIISYRNDSLWPTVVTSNLGLAQIDTWEPRIASRLGGWRVVAMSGKDRRLESGADA